MLASLLLAGLTEYHTPYSLIHHPVMAGSSLSPTAPEGAFQWLPITKDGSDLLNRSTSSTAGWGLLYSNFTKEASI